jgi:hypothetical protein
MLTGSASNTLAPGFRAIIGTNLKERTMFYSTPFDIETSERNYEDYFAAAGLPIAPRKYEAQEIVAVDALEGTTKRVDFEEWGIGFEVSETAWEDDLYASSGSPFRAGANGIADSLAERVEVEAHRPLNAEGFDGTFTVLPDGSALFATSHSPITGGEAAAQANRPSPEVDLSTTSLRAGLIVGEKYVNDRGLRIPGFTQWDRLIIPPDLRFDAEEILNSRFRPDSANNIDNVTPGMSMFVSPYITDSDQWIIQARRHFMKFFWRSRPRFDSFDDRSRRVAVFVGWQRFRVLPIHWLGVYGSTGI